MAVALEGLGLDPEGESKRRGLNTAAIFKSLEREGTGAGASVARIALKDVIENLPEGPTAPVLLIHKTGHLSVLFGTIRVNDRLLYQVVHGDHPVSLVSKQALLEAGFEEAWRFERPRGTGVPIHIGAAVVEIDKLWHNFGEALPGKSLECTFRLRNVGDKVVILDRPFVSCQCTVPNLTDKTKLTPGETLDVKVTTTETTAPSLRNSVGLTFYEQGSGTSREVRLTLIGSQRESMEVTPAKLDFGLVIPGRPSSRTVTLREKPTDRFVLKEVNPGNLPLGCRIAAPTRDRHGLATYRVHLELNVDGEASGKRQGELVLVTDSVVRPMVTIPIVYEVEPPVQAIPSVVSFGTVRLNEVREEKVRLASRNAEPLEVQVVACPDECSITIDQKSEPPQMTVALKLSKPGIWHGTIKVKAKGRSSFQEHLIDIACVGYGRR